MAADSFYEIITQAINDIAEHGYDNPQRIAYWLERIREAAQRTMRPPEVMERMLRETMAAVYRKQIEQGQIIKLHPGVERFTIEKVKPQLRAELDRRIMASADLIRLNRDETLRKTLQRFAGWSTSIPAGGSDAVDKRETKQDIRKALAQLPFQERRVLIDQGQKLTAAMSDILATDGGAIAAIWRHHHVTYPREEHVRRDGKVFLIRDSWAHKAGLVKRGAAGYTDEIEKPGEFVMCRCSYQYRYALRDLPDGMLTAKGREEMTKARAVA